MKKCSILMLAIALAAGFFLPVTRVEAADTDMHIRLSWRGDPSTTVTVTWDTATGLSRYTPEVHYGMSPGNYTGSIGGTSNSSPYTGATVGVHTVELTGLCPETRYYYVCGSPAHGWSSENSFTTAPAGEKGFRFTACGDSRQEISLPEPDDPNGYLQIWESVVNSIREDAPLFTIFNGDMIYTYPGDVPRTEAKWSLWYEKLEPLSEGSVLMSSIGNHEADVNAYLARMALPSQPSSGKWYSFDVSNVHFVCLDSGINSDDEALIAEQVSFLDNDLANARANGAEWIVAYFHKVAYSTLADAVATSLIQEYWVPLFERYNVDLVIQAHKHYYERSWPMYNGQPTTSSGNYYLKIAGSTETVYIVSGGAGGPLRDPVIPPSAGYPWLAVGAKEYHHCVIDVNGRTLRVEAKKPDGITIDEFWIEKPASTWYLAEGSTAWGFNTYVTIENSNTEQVTARITYMGTGGGGGGAVLKTRDIELPGGSQATVDPRVDIGDVDFSTRVECLEGKAIAADRTMTWTGLWALSSEGHSSVGVTGPSDTWYLPEGSSAWGFETWVLVQNPNNAEANVKITYMLESGSTNVVESKIGPSSRATFNMADAIPNEDASVKVESDLPVIAERSMYRNSRREGHCSIGTTTPSIDYYLAEGTSAWGFVSYILVQNPNPAPADVTVTYMTPGGPARQEPFIMAANSRKTIRVNDVMPNTDLSAHVHGSVPIIAERAMYWDGGQGEACHDSVGMSTPHKTFYLPDGNTDDGNETWTLVQNPNDTDVEVQITYLKPDGVGNISFKENIQAGSRRTFNMADNGIHGRAAVMVECLTTGRKIMAERAMYWNSRGAGTDTIGGYSD